MAAEVWEEIYERLAQLIGEHRTTLVFVNTRRLAERMTMHLSERVGVEHVTSHHGSLSRDKRLEAEQRLKEGKLKALVATASLELGIDIGAVDLVCQIGSTRSIATLLQRVGRSGHHLAAVPKGRLFPLSRDELIECAALVRAARERTLDRLIIPTHPLDILAQQIVAAVACEEWQEDALFELVRGAYPYRDVSRKDFDAVVQMLAEGFTTRRGRRGAYVHNDGVNRRLRARRGARLAALTSGGAIPDIGDYRVILEPTETFVGTLNEDFAIESMPGDIFQLGNRSYLIQKIESGQVRVVDAQGQPPSIPFWLGEAPGRTPELSQEVSRLRRDVGGRLADAREATAWLAGEIPGVPEPAARQMVEYLEASQKILGVIPTQETLVLERFFDEAGGMQLVLHAPFGSRVNRAWGLALRKRFCRSFNFELQAAATEDAIVLSLGPQHSFPLEDVFQYLKPETAEHLLVQAMLDAPMFGSSSIACTSRCSAVSGFRYWNTSSSGKLCWGPSDRTIASSVAAAWSSKLKLRQNRLRSASPHARFTRLPNGACSTSCIPPASSKKRSSTSVCCVGMTPRILCDASRYSTTCRAAASGRPGISPPSQASASVIFPSRLAMSWRSRDTCTDSSGVRPGASPVQKGMEGGCPCASTTRTWPDSIFRMRYELLPSWKMSPGMLSIAKSSLSVPTNVSVGSSITR